jgi:hypothetical protein
MNIWGYIVTILGSFTFVPSIIFLLVYGFRQERMIAKEGHQWFISPKNEKFRLECFYVRIFGTIGGIVGMFLLWLVMH